MEVIHILRTTRDYGQQLGVGPVSVHERGTCHGEFCSIHNPSDHPLKDAPLNWRGDRGLMERICACGIGHPDPDGLAFMEATDPEQYARQAPDVHGCCGCCV